MRLCSSSWTLEITWNCWYVSTFLLCSNFLHKLLKTCGGIPQVYSPREYQIAFSWSRIRSDLEVHDYHESHGLSKVIQGLTVGQWNNIIDNSCGLVVRFGYVCSPSSCTGSVNCIWYHWTWYSSEKSISKVEDSVTQWFHFFRMGISWGWVTPTN